MLLIRPPAHRPQRVIGQPGYGCWHSPPVTWGSPNGAFPMTNGKYLVTEINGDWVDALGLAGPSLGLPLPNGDILVNDDFNDRVIVIDPVTNRIVWQYGTQECRAPRRAT